MWEVTLHSPAQWPSFSGWLSHFSPYFFHFRTTYAQQYFGISESELGLRIPEITPIQGCVTLPLTHYNVMFSVLSHYNVTSAWNHITHKNSAKVKKPSMNWVSLSHLFSIPASSATVERLFSFSGDVLTDLRLSLSDSLSCSIMFLHSNKRWFWPWKQGDKEMKPLIKRLRELHQLRNGLQQWNDDGFCYSLTVFFNVTLQVQ